jgi:hypothetical protein
MVRAVRAAIAHGVSVFAPTRIPAYPEVIAMTTIQAAIPDDLHQALLEHAQREKISVDALVSRSLRASMAVPMLGLTMEERAAKADLAEFDRIMARVPSVPPVPGDELI